MKVIDLPGVKSKGARTGNKPANLFEIAAGLVFPVTVALLLAVVVPGAFAASRVGEHVRVMVEKILYIGDDKYEIEISLTNRWDRGISLLEYEKHFIVQNDIIGRWTELELKEIKPAEPVFIPPRESYTTSVQVKIPASLPNLYVNYDNEVNIMLKHRVLCRTEKDEKTVSITDDSSYWLKPKTSQWILREGM